MFALLTFGRGRFNLLLGDCAASSRIRKARLLSDDRLELACDFRNGNAAVRSLPMFRPSARTAPGFVPDVAPASSSPPPEVTTEAPYFPSKAIQ